jgi:hypothetical protein
MKENKLRKEESAAIIKKLAFVPFFQERLIMRSERVVDTSYLQSTKTIGQRKEGKQTEERGQNVDTLENENSRGSSSERDERDDGDHFAPIQLQPPPPAGLEMSQIGAALKTSFRSLDRHNPSVRKLKRQNKPSWRQRLQDARPTSKTMDNECTDRDISSPSSESGEYSEWSGFSSDDSVVVDPKDEPLESFNGVGLLNGLDRTSGTEVTNHESDTEGERTQQRAKYFKLWAREQSGFGGSQSNISSLPPLPPMLREVATADFSGLNHPPVSTSNDVKSQRVYLSTGCD